MMHLDEKEHENLRDMLGLWALGALDSDADHKAVVAHLADCESCQLELEKITATVAELPFAADAVAPPAELRNRILQSISAGSEPAATDAEPAQLRPARRPSRFSAWRPSLAMPIAASFLLALTALGLGAHAWDLRGQLDRERELLADAKKPAPTQEVSLEAATADAPRVVTSGPLAGARGRIAASDGVAFVVIENLPEPPEGKVWQAWTIDERNEPTSMGTLDTSRAVAIWKVDGDALRDMRAFAITAEPAGGSPGPTTRPHAFGRVA